MNSTELISISSATCNPGSRKAKPITSLLQEEVSQSLHFCPKLGLKWISHNMFTKGSGIPKDAGFYDSASCASIKKVVRFLNFSGVALHPWTLPFCYSISMTLMRVFRRPNFTPEAWRNSWKGTLLFSCGGPAKQTVSYLGSLASLGNMIGLKVKSVPSNLSRSASTSWAGITGLLLPTYIPQTTVKDLALEYYTMVSIPPIMPSSRTLSMSWWTRVSLSPPVFLISMFPLASFWLRQMGVSCTRSMRI